MTQNMIDNMNTIVDLMAHGTKLSDALKTVYSKRNVAIPFDDEMLDVDIKRLNLSNRTMNALMREHIFTVRAVVDYCNKKKITTIKNLGFGSGTELFESILDYYWDRMNNKERTEFLIDCVERNEEFVRI